MGEAYQVLGLHSNHASSRAINVGNKKEGDGHSKGQHDQQRAGSMVAVADQQITTDGNSLQQDPRLHRNAVPPGGLSVSL